MSVYSLYTIGYEGQGIEEFVSWLKRHGITRLIDVREIPISRKRGFSKSRLRERLMRVDFKDAIGYTLL